MARIGCGDMVSHLVCELGEFGVLAAVFLYIPLSRGVHACRRPPGSSTNSTYESIGMAVVLFISSLVVGAMELSIIVASCKLATVGMLYLTEASAKKQKLPRCADGKRDHKSYQGLARCAPQPGRISVMGSSQVMTSTSHKALEVSCLPAKGLDAQVKELARNSTPTPADEHVVQRLSRMVQERVAHIVPNAEIIGLARSNLAVVADLGSKPEVDIIVTVDPAVLAEQLNAHFARMPTSQSKKQKTLCTLSPRGVQKSATRVLSECLDFLKFWRSQYTAFEPKVVLLGRSDSLGLVDFPIVVNFSVNTPYPLRLAAVLSNADAWSRDLIYLVTRWAYVRGVAHGSKGHLHKYGWGLLVLYFLRHRQGDGEPMAKTTIELFDEFVASYRVWFSRTAPAMMVLFGSASSRPSQHDILPGTPYVEDLFAERSNVADTMSIEGVARLREELSRAAKILSRKNDGTTFQELMERWTPPAWETSEGACGAEPN